MQKTDKVNIDWRRLLAWLLTIACLVDIPAILVAFSTQRYYSVVEDEIEFALKTELQQATNEASRSVNQEEFWCRTMFEQFNSFRDSKSGLATISEWLRQQKNTFQDEIDYIVFNSQGIIKEISFQSQYSVTEWQTAISTVANICGFSVIKSLKDPPKNLELARKMLGPQLIGRMFYESTTLAILPVLSDFRARPHLHIFYRRWRFWSFLSSSFSANIQDCEIHCSVPPPKPNLIRIVNLHDNRGNLADRQEPPAQIIAEILQQCKQFTKFHQTRRLLPGMQYLNHRCAYSHSGSQSDSPIIAGNYSSTALCNADAALSVIHLENQYQIRTGPGFHQIQACLSLPVRQRHTIAGDGNNFTGTLCTKTPHSNVRSTPGIDRHGSEF
jgi:hypothetical protein